MGNGYQMAVHAIGDCANREVLNIYADIVVLSKDVVMIPENEIPSTQVLYTIIGGKACIADSLNHEPYR